MSFNICFYIFRVTEQVTVLLLSLLAVICICSTNIILVPFSDKLNSRESTFIQMVLAINVGRYIYLIFQDAFLYSHIEKQKFRTDMVHHAVTVVCYCVMLAYQQNRLLGILGILTEINTITIEMTKMMKTVGRHKTGIYKKMSIANCAITIVFRAVIPVMFLIMGMFHETPFVMHYTALTLFFLSIIFFSVINVWLVLSSIQRVIKIYGNTGSSLDISSGCTDIQLHQLGSFRQNNLGYERPMGNININNLNYDDEKLNINKKYMPKTNIKNVYLVNETGESAMANEEQLESNNNLSENSCPEQHEQASRFNRSNNDRSSQRSVSINSCSILLSPPDDGVTETNLPRSLNIDNSVISDVSDLPPNDLSGSLSDFLPNEQLSMHTDDQNSLW